MKASGEFHIGPHQAAYFPLPAPDEIQRLIFVVGRLKVPSAQAPALVESGSTHLVSHFGHSPFTALLPRFVQRPILLVLLGTFHWSVAQAQLATQDTRTSVTTNAFAARPFAPPSNTVRSISPEGTNVPAAGVTNRMDALDDKHKLAIGDRLSFRIVEDEEDPKPLVVTDSGELEVPYIGRFPVVGKSCRELAWILKGQLEKEYYYRATVLIGVDLMARSRGKVYLIGPVRLPGPQEIPSDELLTLSKAILRAGGFTDLADKNHVKITRKGNAAGASDQKFTVNVAEILEKGKSDSDVTLEPDDFVYIPERLIRF